ncbi:uncharacterized protein [Gossypium hirsutum]|uniref:Tf2-1-like SH3-like domain-containing protein n=1 Tax=Gossypium hirsutum TaxID=3635 RepID=A0A1U8PXW4_GOSHI|nr:uncharacterized protein LOC107963035 [Gossypium hirsutum]
MVDPIDQDVPNVRDATLASVKRMIELVSSVVPLITLLGISPGGRKEGISKEQGSEPSVKGAPKESPVRLEGRAPTRTYAIRAREEASSPNVITGHCFSANLMLLPFDEFDVILGMDWLTTHDVVVNCGRKFIELKCENGNVLRVELDELNGMPAVISSMSARRCIRKGYEAYLAFVLNTKESELRIESVPVVREYLDVFLEELSGLPPIKEVEFGIDLTPSTAPISIAPYRMVPIEIKELKVFRTIVSGDGIRVDPSKISAIVDWKSPKNVTEANVVADALSKKSLFSLRAMNARLALSDDGTVVVELRTRPMFPQEICEGLSNDYELQAKRTQCESGSESDFQVDSDGCLMFRDRICVSKDSKLIDKILNKVLRIGRKGKLSPHSIGPYEITERIGLVAYRLALPPEFENIHDVFHVSVLHRYRSDPSHVISPIEVKIQPNMTYGEESIKILDREVKQLRNKKAP